MSPLQLGFCTGILFLASATANSQGIQVGRISAPEIDQWKLSGECWGRGAANNSQLARQILNASNDWYLLSCLESNRTTGEADSEPFILSKDYLSFLVCGGDFPGRTCVNLLVDGKVRFTATGGRTLAFHRVVWDVSGLTGRMATIQVVDHETADWGFIGADDFRLTDNGFRLVNESKGAASLQLDGRIDGFAGYIVYPVPPSDPCQRVSKISFKANDASGERNAVVVSDQSPLKKPVLEIEIPSRGTVNYRLRVDVEFLATRLVQDISEHPAPSLTPEERNYYLDQGWRNPAHHAWFKKLIADSGLDRCDGESDLAYAQRVLLFEGRTMSYAIPDNNPEWKELKAEQGYFGDWLYMSKTHTGECLRLSAYYANVLREAGIPVRQVSGNWTEGDFGHHLRDLIWIKRIGWVPVEPTAAVTGKRENPNEVFGFWPGKYLSGNESVDYHVPYGGRTFNVGTFDNVIYLDSNGSFVEERQKLHPVR